MQADLAQVQADFQSVQEQTRRYVEIEATRPLTRDETKQAWALRRQGYALRLRLRHLRVELSQLPGRQRPPEKK